LPSKRIIATSPRSGRHTAVRINPIMPYMVFDPDCRPTLSGYMRLPAPNNMENIANPTVIICAYGLFCIYNHSLRIKVEK
jgi:hypothetical protein